MGVKKLKNGPKSGREKAKMPVKKLKNRPKIAFTGTFIFTGKKKNTAPRGIKPMPRLLVVGVLLYILKKCHIEMSWSKFY